MAELYGLDTFITDTAEAGYAELIDLAKSYLTDDADATKSLHFQLQAQELLSKRRVAALQAVHAAQQDAATHQALLEGTAQDLRAVPYLGAIMLFARGAQRPLWGFVVMYLDYLVYSGHIVVPDGALSTAFVAINLLVLGFLFGERATQNLLPLFARYLGWGKTDPAPE